MIIILIQGKITSVETGSKQIRASYSYAYFTIVLQTEEKRYLLFFSYNLMNKIGYLPKINHTIVVDGLLGKSNDNLYDGVIKSVRTIKHIK